jgi:toxin-antitoxin system PIN domain toxin
MTSCDTNILFIGLNQQCLQHTAALRFLQNCQNDAEFALCELVLAELYVLLRNPAVSKPPLSAKKASEAINQLRAHPKWALLDYPGNLMNEVWSFAEDPGFAARQIFDARLAVTLRHHGVKNFATANVKHFQNYGFQRVWNPLLETLE